MKKINFVSKFMLDIFTYIPYILNRCTPMYKVMIFFQVGHFYWSQTLCGDCGMSHHHWPHLHRIFKYQVSTSIRDLFANCIFIYVDRSHGFWYLDLSFTNDTLVF